MTEQLESMQTRECIHFQVSTFSRFIIKGDVRKMEWKVCQIYLSVINNTPEQTT